MDGESRAGYVWVPKSEDVEFKGGFFVVIYMLWSLEWPAVMSYWLLHLGGVGFRSLLSFPKPRGSNSTSKIQSEGW